jgi:enoyl-CoA hydratase/3-hydroxyacyl-CoA dehydrogenase
VYCRGGLIKYADLVGAKHVVDRLNGWAAQFESAGLAGFFKPCEYLANAAKNGTQLGAGVAPGSRM